MIRKALLLATTFSTLAGCASLRPDLTPAVPPAISVPVAYDYVPEITEAAAADAHWWDRFRDPSLSRLIDQAMAENLDVETNLSNIKAARAALRASEAARLPSVSGSGSTSADTNTNLDDISVSARISASYELDVFGTRELEISSAQLGVESSVYSLRSTQLSVQADVATNYFNLLAALNQLHVAELNLAISERIYGIVKARYDNGAVSGFDLASQESSLATARARLPAIQAQIDGYEAALAILTGVPPQGFSVNSGDLKAVAIPQIDVGLPSDLLWRRPDILSAEAALRSANIDVSLARAAFLPTIDLGAGLSKILTSGADPVASVSAALSLPIFNGGRLAAQLEASEARAEIALTTYRKAILTALSDVDIAQSSLKANQAVTSDLETAASAAVRALEIAEVRYRVGADNLTSLLNAQQTRDSAEQSVIQNRRDRMISLVNLYAALGGDVWAE